MPCLSAAEARFSLCVSTRIPHSPLESQEAAAPHRTNWLLDRPQPLFHRGRINTAKALAYHLNVFRLAHLSDGGRSFPSSNSQILAATPQERDAQDRSDHALLASSGYYSVIQSVMTPVALEDLRASMNALGLKSKHIAFIFSRISPRQPPNRLVRLL